MICPFFNEEKGMNNIQSKKEQSNPGFFIPGIGIGMIISAIIYKIICLNACSVCDLEKHMLCERHYNQAFLEKAEQIKEKDK